MGVCKIDATQLKNLRDNLQKFNSSQRQQLIDTCAKELAARFYAKVVKRTPVGVYPTHVHFVTKLGQVVDFDVQGGKVGGTLRRNWKVGTPQRTGSGTNIKVENTTHYAIYVEYGHRTPNGAGWVKGQFFMTISAEEIERSAPSIIEARIAKELGKII